MTAKYAVTITFTFTLLTIAVQLSAQTTTGSIGGSVQDPQGAAVPNAMVIATEQDKNVSTDSKLGSVSSAAHFDPGRVWNANRIPGSIEVFDAESGSLLGRVRTGNGTLDIALPPGVGKIYGSDESDGTISVADVASLTVVAVIPFGADTKPHHMDSNPDGTLIYASLFGTNQVAAVDTATDTIAWVQTLGPDTALVHGTAINTLGDTLWVTNGSGGTFFAINELDAHTGEVRRSMEVEFDWSEVALNIDETRLFASDKTLNQIRVFEIDTLAEVGSVSVPQNPDTMSLTKDGKTLLVGLRGQPATCAFVDVDTLTATTLELSTATGTSTGHHDLSSTSRFGYISVDGMNAPPHIAVLDMETRSVITTWPNPGRPHGVIFEPDSNR